MEPNIREIHTYLASVLGGEAALDFCKELWRHCLSAQENSQDNKPGVSKELIATRAAEIEQHKVTTLVIKGGFC